MQFPIQISLTLMDRAVIRPRMQTDFLTWRSDNLIFITPPPQTIGNVPTHAVDSRQI